MRIASKARDLADENPVGASTHFTFSRSTLRAADILNAWYENDPELLVQELAKGSAPESALGDDCCERERLDLLDGITAQIASSISSGQDAGVYIDLLQHLATPGGPQNEFWKN